MDVLIADKQPAAALERLKGAGHSVTYEPDLTAEDLPHRIAGFDVLVVRSTWVTAETVSAGDRLALVVRAGAGTNTIDTSAAARRGVFVCNVPGKNAIAVAELTIGLILAHDRRIPDAVKDLRAGRWNKKEYSRARGVYGRTLGIIGLGDIGLAVAERAHGLGMRTLGLAKTGRSAEAVRRIEAAGIEFVTTIEELARSDVVTVHVPYGPDTHHLIDAEFLALMRDGCLLVDTSRGGVVDEDALLEAIERKGIRAALDVFENEPAAGVAEFDDPIAAHRAVYGTHHIGASTEQAQEAIGAEVVRVISAFARGQIVNCVNLETAPIGTATVVVRHLDRVGVLAGVFDVLRSAHINVEHMENVILAGAEAASATIHVSGDVPAGLVDRLAAIDHVLAVSVRRHA